MEGEMGCKYKEKLKNVWNQNEGCVRKKAEEIKYAKYRRIQKRVENEEEEKEGKVKEKI